MTDPVTLFVGIAGQLKTAADIAIGLSKLQTMAEVNAKAIELQGTILGLQSDAFMAHAQQTTMIQRVRDLEEEIANAKAWEETRQRYQLVSPVNGIFFYALKENSGTSEPPHWICTNCYENGKRSIVHKQWNPARGLEFNCPQCKALIHPTGSDCPPPTYA